MVKPRDIKRKISKAAKAQGLVFKLTRHGSRHDIYELEGQTFSIPRHDDVNRYTAEDMYKDAEPILGERWWR